MRVSLQALRALFRTRSGGAPFEGARSLSDSTYAKMVAALMSALIASSLSACGDAGSPSAEAAPTAPEVPLGGTDAPPPERPALPEGCTTMTLPGGRALDYCARVAPERIRPASVVYFFHGLGGSAEDLFREPYASLTDHVLKRMGDDAPDFVSLSVGRSGVIPTDGRDNSLAGEIAMIGMTRIERELGHDTGAGPEPQRILMGGSMGGFNVLSLAASRRDHYKAVISVCPALIRFDPFSPGEIEAYIERHQPYVSRSRVELAISHLKRNFPTPAEWSESDPIRQISRGSFDGLPIFMSIGRQDEFGYIEGAETFAHEAKARELAITWKPVPGVHCFFDPQALLAFLQAAARPPAPPAPLGHFAQEAAEH